MASGVTFQVATHPPNPVRLHGTSNELQAQSLVSHLKEYSNEGCGRILQSTPLLPHTPFLSSNNGFVHGVVQAYCHHHNLLIRPDDVWLAIAIQFGFFINANSESLRSLFVAHQGKKELKVKQMATLDTADYGRLASDMVAELRRNIKDPGFCDWVLPHFSTTTHNDKIVGSVTLMATMKNYFDYKFRLCCGIPQVTLAGTVADWEEVHSRVEKLQDGGYGKECSAWASMLLKITSKFIQTSKNEIDIDFWSRICHYRSGGSGPSYLSGWITAFCVFDGKGKWQATRFSVPDRSRPCIISDQQVNPPSLDFPVIDTSDIPPGYITVDVTVDDNGIEHKALMFAGHMGYDIMHQGKGVAPKLAWAMVLKSSGQAKAASTYSTIVSKEAKAKKRWWP